MKAFVFKETGIENLKLQEVNLPEGDGIRVKIKMAAINPLDYNAVTGNIVYGLNPVPHIAGSEAIGELLEDGKELKKGDRVIIYNRIFDSSCEMCLSGKEYLCENGGIWGIATNGAFAEEARIPEKNLLRIPEYITDLQAVSLPIAALTPFHALLRSGARAGEKLLVFGASGNTGIFSMQIGKIMGLDVYAVCRSDLCKVYDPVDVFTPDSIPENFRADLVVNPLGKETWEKSLKHTAMGGRMITFGVLTGREGITNIADLYTKEKTIIGSTGGSITELKRLLDIMKYHQLRVPVARTFPFHDLPEALKYFKTRKNGRVIVDYTLK